MGKWPHAKANTAALAAVAAAIDLGPDAPPVELRNQSAHGAELKIEAEGLWCKPSESMKRTLGIIARLRRRELHSRLLAPYCL